MNMANAKFRIRVVNSPNRMTKMLMFDWTVEISGYSYPEL
jgi:hypothetical protein